MVLWPACSDSDERTLPGRASPGAEPAATPTPQASPEEEIAQTLERFTTSVKDEDARSTANLLDRDTIRYLKRLRRHVGSAGPAQIARLTPWEKLALTGLRTDFDEKTLGALSVEGFLDHMMDYEEIFLAFERFEPRRLRVEGSRAVAIMDVPRPRLRLELERSRGSWRIDARALFYRVDEGLALWAKGRGRTVDEQILRFAEDITAYGVLPDVWEKPE
jgi:hypothetical protein